jgi:ribosomal protein L11
MVDFKAKKEQQNLSINNYLINFTIFSFANQAKAVPPLGPILGQYNINLLEFCNKFNLLTKDYQEGLQLFGIVKKKIKSKEFELEIKKLSLKIIFEVFLSNYLNSEDPYELEKLENIPVEIIYDIVKLYSILYNLNIKSSQKLVLSYLKSNVFIKKIEC